MKKVYRAMVACLLLSIAITSLASAQGGDEGNGRDPALEQEIYDRLAQISPDAVPIFQEATQAMDAGDLETAQRNYEQVLELAPDFPDAARRLSYVELDLEDVEAGLRYAELAYRVDPQSAYNRSALAWAMLATDEPDLIAKALPLAQSAAQAMPDDADMCLILIVAGAMNDDLEVVRQASTELIQLDPNHPWGHYFAGLFAAEDGRWVEAERQLLLSQELGMPAEQVQSVLDKGIRSQARFHRWLRRGGYLVAGWLVGLGALLLVGMLLSKLTLVTAYRVPSSAQFEIGAAERLVRGIYRSVITIASLYFYVSIPVLILIVIAGAGGILYFFYQSGRMPIKLAAIIAGSAFFTLVAIVRSALTRLRETEPGRPLSREEAPGLWSLVEEVAERLDTRPVDAIYVTPGSGIAVTERGGLWKKLCSAGQRCLILGLGALPGMTQGQFKAILAHEYGHFSHRDTAGGDLAHQVQASLRHMDYRLALKGQSHWFNPAWLFINAFYRIFLRITLGASRLQEILADRYAAMAYGAQNFIGGLTHIVRQDLVFNVQVNNEIGAAVRQGRDFHNLYALPSPQDELDRKRLKVEEDEVMSRPTSAYDSHPAPRERIVLVEKLQAEVDIQENPAPVWDLLPNAEDLQAEMTAMVQEDVRRQRGQVE
jgi:Zn-dependent protease with chaperone function/tetratricopeptide (TPR) repeat protein